MTAKDMILDFASKQAQKWPVAGRGAPVGGEGGLEVREKLWAKVQGLF